MSAVVLAYGAEPWLERCVHALLDSKGIAIEVILVDNGCTDGAVERLRDIEGVTHVGTGANLGFSGGCNLGAASASGEHLALVNGDLVVETDALARLVTAVADPGIGIAAGSVRLGDDPTLLNTSGNEIHFLGFSWVGDFGEPAATKAVDRDVAGAMGALALMRRAVWDRLEGFDAHFFAFHEDADLSWRCWQAGLRVRYVPDAVGIHRYEFGRVERKLYLAERNRLIFFLTCWEARTIALLAPVLVPMELAIMAAAAKGGWLREKVDGWKWLISHAGWLRERRRQVQHARTVNDRSLAHLLTDHLDAKNYPLPKALQPFDDLLAKYWALARRLLAR